MPFRLGSPGKTGSLSLVTPAGGALSGMKTRWLAAYFSFSFVSIPR
jgi:hypothetical protein